MDPVDTTLREGEFVEVDGAGLEVLEMDGHRVGRVRISRIRAPGEEAPQEP